MTPQRSQKIGVGLAAVQLVVAAVLALLGVSVRMQGLPQDYDTVATMSIEAVLLARMAVIAAIPLLVVFLASAVLLTRGRAVSRLWTRIGAAMLAAGLLLGAVGYIIWGRMGW